MRARAPARLRPDFDRAQRAGGRQSHAAPWRAHHLGDRRAPGGYTRGARLGRDSLDSLCFEDLPLGGRWTTRRRTITPADLAAFVGVAGDFNPLLIDQPFARTTSFGGPVVPGTLTAAVAVGLGSLDVPIPDTAGMVGMNWRFQHPVRPGDSIHGVWRLNRKRPVENPALGLCFWQIEVFNEQGTLVAVGEVGRLVRRRQPAIGESPNGREAEPEPASAPARSRRRRRRPGTAEKERVAAVVEAQPVPEPANSDVPAPARRRRRRRGNGGGQGNGHANGPTRTEPDPVPAAAAPPPPSAEAGRGLRGVLRRLRGS